MLSSADIGWIKDNRPEITGNRQTQISISYAGEGTIDEITGEVTAGKPKTRNVMAVVTEITTLAEAGIERLINNGIAIEKGDIWLSISYDLVAKRHFPSIIRFLTAALYASRLFHMDLRTNPLCVACSYSWRRAYGKSEPNDHSVFLIGSGELASEPFRKPSFNGAFSAASFAILRVYVSTTLPTASCV